MERPDSHPLPSPAGGTPPAVTRALLEAVADGAALLDTGGHLLHLNGEGARLLGVASSELTGRPILETLEGAPGRAESHAQGGTPLARALVSGEACRSENGLFLTPAGHELCVAYALAPLVTDGRRTGALLLFRENGAARRRLSDLERGADRQRKLLDGVRDVALLMLDAEGRITTWDAGAQALTGYPGPEALGQPVGFLVDLDTPDGETPAAGLFRAARDGRSEERAWWRRADGSRFWAETTTTALRGADGHLEGYARLTRDGTRRRQEAERQATLFAVTRVLAETATLDAAAPRLLEALAAGVGGAMGEIWRVDSRAGHLHQVAAWRRPELEAPRGGEARGLTFGPWRGLPGRVWSGGQAIWIRDIRNDVNYLLNSPAATLGMGSALAFPIRAEGEIAGVITLFGRHINAPDEALLNVMAAIGSQVGEFLIRQRAEEDLHSAHAETEQLFSAIASILIGVDGQDVVRRWNGSAESVFGISTDSAVGHPLHACPIGWDLAEIGDAIAACRAGGQPVRLDLVPCRRAGDQEGFLTVTLSPVPARDGGPAGVLLLAIDITERRQLEAQLAQAQKLESIGQLAAGIAHEINTPIQYVGDNLRFLSEAFRDLRRLQVKYEFLMMEARRGRVPVELVTDIDNAMTTADTEFLAREVPRALQQSLEGVDRMAGIVKAMKEFSHPGGADKLAIDLNRSIENTLTVARSAYRDVADVVTDFDRNIPAVPVLVAEFNQVILNIGVNAAQAIKDVVGPKGEQGRGVIVIQTRGIGDQAEIRIRDTGPGIPEAIQSRVFDPFFTTREVGTGTGQGLAIAHAVITRKHSGQLTFETAPGRGTTFVIRLPLYPPLPGYADILPADPAREGAHLELETHHPDAARILGLDRTPEPGPDDPADDQREAV